MRLGSLGIGIDFRLIRGLAGGGGGGWTPADVTTMWWVKADDTASLLDAPAGSPASVNGVVGQWNSQVNGLAFVQNTTGFKPYRRSPDGVDFQDTDDRIDMSGYAYVNTTVTDQIYFALAINCNVGAGYDSYLCEADVSTSNQLWHLYATTGTRELTIAIQNGANAVTGLGAYLDGAGESRVIIHFNPTTDVIKVYVNGVQKGNISLNQGAWPSIATNPYTVMGMVRVGSSYFHSADAIYREALCIKQATEVDVSDIDTYLSRWS